MCAQLQITSNYLFMNRHDKTVSVIFTFFNVFVVFKKKFIHSEVNPTFFKVCEGDTITVNVDNFLTGAEGTSIHWHGVYQHGSQHMDGVAMLTQCPIPAYTTFQYK